MLAKDVVELETIITTIPQLLLRLAFLITQDHNLVIEFDCTTCWSIKPYSMVS
jgi:hypothetical protein